MTAILFEIRPGAYYDSIVLMQLQRALAEQSDVLDAGVVMGTPANLDLLADGDILPEEAKAARQDDLLLVVKAADEAAAVAALAQVDALLTRHTRTHTSTFRPRSVESAFKALPNARWALISVPGKYAADVARQVLDAGRHAFLYSDNVSLADEIALKTTAQAKGLLVMGPDCGTAIINGVGLGFANRVRRGTIGVVAASGTGLQAVTVAVHNLGHGISHAIGTGGRDLKADVGGISALTGLAWLAQDPGTHVIVIVSKPPHPAVAARLLAAARQIDKPVVVNFLGQSPPARRMGNLHFAVSLQETAQLAVEFASSDANNGHLRMPDSSVWEKEASPAATDLPPLTGNLRGLFSGGTLAMEALLGLQDWVSPLYSNVPLRPEQALADPLTSQAHTILDLGEDLFTVGRLHPMLDNDLRLRRLRQEAADPDVSLIYIDVVLGDGAHPDPAAELAPAIAAVRAAHGVEVVVVIIGTDEDPQDLAAQAQRFEAAGAAVFRDVTAANEHITARFAPSDQRRLSSLGQFPGVSKPQRVPSGVADLNTPFAAINIGLESFHDSLIDQGAESVHVVWRPPAAGNEKLMGILAKLRG